MVLAKIAVILYGVLALIGGIIGYKNAKSKVSLISGTISGILLLLGGIVSFLGQSWGLPLATIVSALLVVVFLVRLWKTRKFMPAGLMIIFGVVVLLLAGSQVVS
jgi:uncharacterized membrane protein (UPF0136 family)